MGAQPGPESSGRGGLGLLDIALDLQRLGRQLTVEGLREVGVEPAAMVHRPQGRGGDAELEAPAEGLALQRDVVQVRQEPATGVIHGVRHVVAGHDALTGDRATSGHDTNPLSAPDLERRLFRNWHIWKNSNPQSSCSFQMSSYSTSS